MGHKTYERQISAAVKEKDERIAYLESQIQAHAARASHINTRLLSTLDTLDVLQAKHDRELASEVRAKERMSLKLDRYMDYTRSSEMEKEDMKEAVLLLVEKEPLNGPLHHPIQSLSQKQYDAYAASLIQSLREERDLERCAHEQFRQHAESQILDLEARLARRDAELEAWLLYGKKARLDHPRQSSPAAEHSIPRLSAEDALQVMQNTSVRNKQLEQEVRALSGMLEKARLRAASLINPPAHASMKDSHAGGRSSAPPNIPPVTSGRTSPLRYTTAHSSQNPVSPDSHFPEDNDDTIRPLQNPILPIILPEPIQDLDNQIAALGSQVNAFTIERRRLGDFVGNNTFRNLVTPDKDHFEKVLLIEEECIRLAKAESTTRAELNALKIATTSRERALQNEIDRLKEAVRRPPTPLGDLLGDSQSEKSMEMATPLPDLTELPPDEYIDPPSIPLPDSRSPSPLSSPGAALSSRAVRGISESSQTSTTREDGHIQNLEARLAAAREDLERKEDALQGLREELERLRIQAPAGQEFSESADLLL
ncbi:hypothetical protein HWV62_25934 [Athelia sp. TMB]|nr:hypothetical protein HWV62_25934 [Athelia sp. TMB]